MSDEETTGLIPLATWNAMPRPGRREELIRPNGIACPTCGSELVDSDPGRILTSLPPRVRVRCQCGFVGSRIL